MTDRPGFEEQMVHMRSQIDEVGQCRLGPEEVRVLCPDYLSVSEQFGQLAEIAKENGWSFAFMRGGFVEFRRIN